MIGLEASRFFQLGSFARSTWSDSRMIDSLTETTPARSGELILFSTGSGLSSIHSSYGFVFKNLVASNLAYAIGFDLFSPPPVKLRPNLDPRTFLAGLR